jgi:hypothetical protein
MQAVRHDPIESRSRPFLRLARFWPDQVSGADFACKALAASKELSSKDHVGSNPNIQKEEAKIALANPLAERKLCQRRTVSVIADKYRDV